MKMKWDEKTKDLLKAFLAMVLVFLSMKLGVTVLTAAGLVPQNDLIAQHFICEVVYAAASLTAFFILKKKELLSFKWKGVGEGLKAGTFILLFTGYLFIQYLLWLWCGMTEVNVGLVRVILFVLYTLLIGVTEEFLFRGIIQNAFHRFFGEDTYKHTVAAILLSGVCFGLYHLTNAFNPTVSFGAALIQVMMVIPVGIMLCSVYYRSGRNLWLCVLLHAAFDAVQFLLAGMLAGNVGLAQIVGGYANITPQIIGVKVVAWSVMMLIALLTVRKSKIHVNTEAAPMAGQAVFA